MSNALGVKNTYYDCFQYNSSQNQVVAKQDTPLIYPIVQSADNNQLCLAKSKIDLSTIPLTQSNIPLKSYEVTLRQGLFEASAYVRQVNSTANNFFWNATPAGTILQYQYFDTGSYTQVSSSDISGYVPFVQNIVVDDFQNVYVVGNNVSSISTSNLFCVFSSQNQLLLKTSYSSIHGLAIDSAQNIYIADEADGVSTIYVYQNSNSSTSVSLTLTTTITRNFANNPLTSISTIAADNTLIVGYEGNTITLYNQLFQPYTDITESAITQIGSASAISDIHDRYCLSDTGINDLVLGLPTEMGIQQAYNVLTNGTVFSNGQWNYIPAINSTNTTYLGQAAGVTYYGAPINGTPNSIVSSPTVQILASTPGNGFYANGASSNNYLYSWAEGGASNWSLMCTDFNAGAPTKLFNSFDISPSSGKIFGVENNLLYKSSNRVLSHQILSPALNTTQLTIQRTDFDNTAGSYTPYSVLDYVLSTFPNTFIVGMYKYYDGTNYGYFVGLTNGLLTPNGVNYVIKTDCAFNVLSSNTMPNFASGNPISAIYRAPVLPGGNAPQMFALFDGVQTYNFYSETDYSLVTSIVLPETLSGASGTNMTHIPSAGANKIFISNGTKVHTYSWDNIGGDFTIPVTVTLPGGYYIGAMCYYPTPSNYLIYCLVTTIPTDYYNMAILSFTDGTFSTILGLSPIDTGTFYNSNGSVSGYFGTDTNWGSNAIQLGQNFSEVYIASLDNTKINIYSNGTYQGSSPIPTQKANPVGFAGGLKINWFSTGFTDSNDSASGNTNSMYSYNINVPTNLDSTLAYVCISRSNADVFYATDTTGNFYTGKYNRTSVVFTSKTVSQTFASISTCRSNVLVAYNSKAYDYTLSNQTLVNTETVGNSQIYSLAKNDVDNVFLMSTSAGSNNLYSFNPSTFIQNWNVTLPNAGPVFSKNGQDIDAGNASIYSYAVLINAINAAFEQAFTIITSQGATFTEAPVLSLDYQTGLLTLSNTSSYSNSVNGISNSTDGILLSQKLYNIITFLATPDTLIPNNYLLTVSTGQNTLTQTGKSIYTFNMLDKILFISNTLFVNDSYQGNNVSNFVITDIDVDTSSFVENLGQQLLYQPNFYRPYTISSTAAVQRIELEIWYSYVNGNQYQLYLNPGTNWSSKLVFIRKFSG